MALHDSACETMAVRSSALRKSADFLLIISGLVTIFDVLAGLACGALALVIYDHRHVPSVSGLAALGPFWREIILGSLLASTVLREPRLASDRTIFAPGRLLAIMRLRGLLALSLLLIVGLVTRAIDDVARLWLLSWAALFAACVGVSRVALLLYVRSLIRRGALREAVAVVTLAGASGQLASRLALEADVVVSVQATAAPAGAPSGPDTESSCDAVGRSLDSVVSLGQRGAIDSVVVAMGQIQQRDLPAIVERLKAIPVQIVLCPDLGWKPQEPSAVRVLGGMPMSIVSNRPIRAWNLMAKIMIDKILSALLLILLAPLLLAIAVAISIDSPGPVIFRQRRNGWAGRSFVLFKFRTMRANDCGLDRQAVRRDPRCTRVGNVLRRTSLDELPQLLNVLLGDMSLVGPRPHVDALHTAQIVGQRIVAEYAQRYRVRPGLTGWAQINGYRGTPRNAEAFRRRVEHDLFYVENWSLLFDARILLATPFVVLKGENAF